MKVANMTAVATIHGLTWGCGSAVDGIRSLASIMPQTGHPKKNRLSGPVLSPSRATFAGRCIIYSVKRTQLYLDEQDWAVLQLKARQSGLTVSELVRRAVRESYSGSTERRKQAMLAFIGMREKRSGLPPTEAYVRKMRSGSRLERLSS
jgi:hypothetical protein